MNAKRINAKFIVGSNDLPETNLKQIVANISAIYGGLTLTTGRGMWAENGDEFDVSTYENVKEEVAHIFEVSATPEDFDLNKLQQCFMPALGYANWIHNEIWETEAYHFSLEAMAEKAIA